METPTKSPAVKRLVQELRELSAADNRDFACEPLEVSPSLEVSAAAPPHAPPLGAQEDMFEWHFVLRGPRDSEFEARVQADKRRLDELTRPAREASITVVSCCRLSTPLSRPPSSSSRCGCGGGAAPGGPG